MLSLLFPTGRANISSPCRGGPTLGCATTSMSEDCGGRGHRGIQVLPTECTTTSLSPALIALLGVAVKLHPLPLAKLDAGEGLPDFSTVFDRGGNCDEIGRESSRSYERDYGTFGEGGHSISPIEQRNSRLYSPY